jgi:predicted phage tail protein
MLKFRGGGGSSTPVQTRDSLATNDAVEVLIGISEGPIKGPVNGPADIYADNTPLEDQFGNPNLSNFTLDFWHGQPTGDQVTMTLGGLSSPLHVNGPANLAKNVPVTVQGVQTQINAVDFRIVINQLFKQNSKGIYTEPLQLKFEYKASTSTTWLPAFTGGTSGVGPVNGGNTNWFNASEIGVNVSFIGDVNVLDGIPTPPPTDPRTVAIDNTNGHAYTWDTGSQVWVQALLTSGQGAAYATFTDTNVSSTVRRVYRAGATPDDARVGDIWQQSTSPSLWLVWNGSAWVTPGVYGGYGPDPQTLNNGVWSITDKVSSATPINIRCFVPSIAGTYQYRVTKLTTDTTQEEFINVQWETLQEIKQTPLNTTNLAMLKVLGQASDQLTAIPNISGIYLGRMVKIPTNYNPVTRVYTGTWDGTYKVDYTNNTAWIFLDFVENTSYGLSSVYPHYCDKWAIYNWAQQCDVSVPKADGTYQPRWTYNDYIQQQRDAKEMAQYIAASAAAVYVDDGNGTVTVLYDDPSAAAVALFTQENVSPEGFSYSYTDIMTRSNDTVVSFTNPDILWQTDKRRLDNSTAGNRITDDFIATGCIDADEALRRARRRQVSSLTEKEFVNFTTNRRGLYLNTWDVILVADVDMGRGLTGRIHSQSDNTITLRDPITLEAGFTYQGVFDLGLSTITQTVVSSTTTSITFDSLPTLPEYATFSLQCSNIGTPKPYRILNIGDDSGAGELIQITAIELNRNKQAYIDAAASVTAINYSSFSDSNVLPPTGVTSTISYKQVGIIQDRVLTLSWNASPSQFVREYKIYHSIDGSLAKTLTTSDVSIDIGDMNRGQHIFEIVAVNWKGAESNPVTYGYDVVGSARPIPAPTNLHLVGGVTATTFNTADVTVAFDPAAYDPNFDHYAMAIGTRTVNLGVTRTYTYKFTDQVKDGLSRNIAVSVVAVDQDGNTSNPITLNISNPAPAAPTFTVTSVSGGFTVSVTPTTELDVIGTMVWVNTTAGQTLGTPTYDANQNFFAIPVSDVNSRYVTVAYYDNFSKTGLNVSAEETVTPGALSATSVPWTGVTGATKPADNATVGANVGNVASNLTTDGYHGAPAKLYINDTYTPFGIASGFNGQKSGSTTQVTRASTSPSSPAAGDIWVNTSVTPNIVNTWSGSAWVAATATDTNQLADTAGLGTKALWAGVTGSGRPADGATVGGTWGVDIGSRPTWATDTRNVGGNDRLVADYVYTNDAGKSLASYFPATTASDKTSNANSAGFFGQGRWATAGITTSSTAPTSPAVYDVWIDTSTTPNQFKRWSGSAWVNATATDTNQLTDSAGLGTRATWGNVTSMPTWVSDTYTGTYTGPKADYINNQYTGNNLATYWPATTGSDKTANANSAGFLNQGRWATAVITTASTAPSSPAVYDVWIDTSVTPNLFKRWNGSVWVSTTPTDTNQLADSAGLGTTATWGNVTGAGRPADGATVGATWGSNLGSMPTWAGDTRKVGGTDRLVADYIYTQDTTKSLAGYFPSTPNADQTSGAVASGITGQGALARKDSVTWTADVSSRPVWMTDTYNGTYVGPKADYINNQNTGSNLANYWPATTGADKTHDAVASGIIGQGGLAQKNQATWNTDMVGMPAWSTDNIAGGVNGGPALNAYYISKVGAPSSYLQDWWPATTGSDKTANATASAIVGQGPWAKVNVTTAATAPSSPATGDIWIDTTYTPNRFNRWSGSAWVSTTATDTNQLSDTANLGGTAAWGGVSSRPAFATDLTGGNLKSGYITQPSTGFGLDTYWPATTGADKTANGIASAIAGQGSLAQKNTVTWTADVSSRPVWMTDTYSGTYVGPKADYINNQGTGANLATYWPATTGADKTHDAVASGILGQGSLAQKNQATWNTDMVSMPAWATDTISGGVNGGPALNAYYISKAGQASSYLQNYWPATTDADKTGNAVAASVAGQGSLALKNAVSWTADVSSRPTWASDTRNVGGTDRLVADYIYTNDSTRSLAAYFPATGAADQTSNANSAGYAGQTSWGTYTGSTARLQYVNDSGKIIDGRAVLPNVGTAQGYVVSPSYPLSSAAPGSTISISATTIYMPNYTLSLGSGTVAGLGSSTNYAVFYDTLAAAYYAISSGTSAYYTDNTGRYIAMGVITTASSSTGSTGGGGGGHPIP